MENLNLRKEQEKDKKMQELGMEENDKKETEVKGKQILAHAKRGPRFPCLRSQEP
jgi:hypothetical protein